MTSSQLEKADRFGGVLAGGRWCRDACSYP
jgi:hypothetical protein